SFGFEKDHYEVSRQVGELVLLPAVREAAEDTLIIADGFSCREQIAQLTDRHALHLAQVLQLALRERREGRPSVDLELQAWRQPARAPARPALTAALFVGAGVLAGGLLLRGLRNGHDGRR